MPIDIAWSTVSGASMSGAYDLGCGAGIGPAAGVEPAKAGSYTCLGSVGRYTCIGSPGPCTCLVSRAFEDVVEVAVGYGQPDAGHRHPGHRPRQEFAADRRQHLVGQNRVNHAAAALDLGAAAHDQ